MSADDIAAWLTEIYDEDEALAMEVVKEEGADWGPGDQYNSDSVINGDGGYVATGSWEYMAWETRRHIAAHDPAAVLARIAADRQILAQREQLTRDLGEASADPRRQMNIPIIVNVALALDTTIKHLASAHADRPGYNEQWRP